MEFTYNFKVNADNKEIAVQIMTSLAKLNKHISPNDLKMLADKIEANPSIIQTAKKYL